MRPPEPSPELHVHSSVNLRPGEQGSSCDALCTPFLRGNLRFALLPLLWAWLCCGCRLAADAGCCWRALPPTPGSAHLLISVFVAPAPLPGAFLAEAGMRSTAGGGFFASQEGCSLGGSFAGSGAGMENGSEVIAARLLGLEIGLKTAGSSALQPVSRGERERKIISSAFSPALHTHSRLRREAAGG